MSNTNCNKIPTKIYVIVSECENLPDLRTEREKKKGKKPTWQVIFPDAKESLTTNFKEGLSKVCWMCECFLTLKSSSNSFSMVVFDENSRKAGVATVKLEDIPPADKQLIKPGRLNEGAREAYRNLHPVQSKVINSTNSTLSYWIWAVEFQQKQKPGSNLGKLKLISRSATNIFKESTQINIVTKKKESNTLNLNPFRLDEDDSVAAKSTNPFEDESNEFPEKHGNSTFATTEYQPFRPSKWIPKEREIERPSSSLNRNRSSSLPGIKEFSKDINFQDYSNNIACFKQNNQEHTLSFAVSESDLTNFKSLGDVYKATFIEPRNEELIKVKEEEFFAILNNTQRRFAINIIKIKTLEAQNKDLDEELTELRARFYHLKTLLINNNMTKVLQDI